MVQLPHLPRRQNHVKVIHGLVHNVLKQVFRLEVVRVIP